MINMACPMIITTLEETKRKNDNETHKKGQKINEAEVKIFIA